jgi:hypothetical protein
MRVVLLIGVEVRLVERAGRTPAQHKRTIDLTPRPLPRGLLNWNVIEPARFSFYFSRK